MAIPTKRLDMDEKLYSNLIEYYAKENLSGAATKGHKVLKSIEKLYDKSKSSIEINTENKETLMGFKNFGVLKGETISDIANEALKIYIQEYKHELQKKIAEL